MDHDRIIHTLFIEAIKKPPSEWPSFLETNCESPNVRDRVQILLDAHLNASDTFLAETAMETFPKLAFPFGGQIEEFRIVNLIGKGGMGHVYLAEDTVLKRLVALKVVGLAETSENSDTVLSRFRREAQAAARLEHPAVVKVHRAGEKDGLSYIAMEYIEGETLREKIDSNMDLRQSFTPKHFENVAILISQVADGMDHAHRAGVIHRDIKPANILIDHEGSAHLADFGIARINAEQTLQQTGTIVGSCAYMSPEQARVLESDVDHRTDIFSLGVVLYEAICFRRPFDGSTYSDVLKALADCQPKPIRKVVPGIPFELSVICHKAIEKEVKDRYQTAAHFFADLQCFIEGRPILARPPSYIRRVRSWARKRQRSVLVGIIFILTTTLIFMTMAFQSMRRAQMGILAVSDEHKGATVTIEVFAGDLSGLEKIKTAKAPFKTLVQPGLYRITIESNKNRLQAIAAVNKGETDIIEVEVPSSRLIKSLVEIKARQFELGESGATRSQMISSFRISPTTVSNQEYREFVLAKKVRPPSYWTDPYDSSINDLPVTAITWNEANKYCRWRGVRMALPDEWEAACQGTTGSRFPWGNLGHLKVLKRNETKNLDFAAYLNFVRPVDSDTHPETPLGIKHMLSNVQEYTSGIDLKNNFGPIVKSRSWADSPYILPQTSFISPSREVPGINRGFRVAISNY